MNVVKVAWFSPTAYRGNTAPSIHRRIVSYSGDPLVKRRPPPCANVADPATPSVSAVEVGFRNSRLFSGLAVSTTFFTVVHVALNSVCVAWQSAQAYPSAPF